MRRYQFRFTYPRLGHVSLDPTTYTDRRRMRRTVRVIRRAAHRVNAAHVFRLRFVVAG